MHNHFALITATVNIFYISQDIGARYDREWVWGKAQRERETSQLPEYLPKKAIEKKR